MLTPGILARGATGRLAALLVALPLTALELTLGEGLNAVITRRRPASRASTESVGRPRSG